MSGQQLGSEPRTLEEAKEEIRRLQQALRRQEQENSALRMKNEGTEEMRRAHQAERDLQNLYNDILLDNTPNMLFLFDEGLRFVTCSPSCAPMLAAGDRLRLKGMPFGEVFAKGVDPAWVEQIGARAQQVLQTRQSARYDDTVTFGNGDLYYDQIALSPVVDGEGACHGVVLSVNDVTELTETKHSAEEAARSKASFLANMSHEIRTPMNAVKGLSELLALTKLDMLQRNYVSNIISSSNSLISIINDVLDFSKIDAGKIDLIEGEYSVAELLAEVTNVVGMRTDSKNLTLLVRAEAGMPSSLWGDVVRVKQVMVNLLGNAVKYTREGMVRMVVYTTGEGETLRLCCDVEDTGIGIRPEDQAGLFDAFTRADLQANRGVMGTGLGLAITKQLVVRMGGEVSVESEYGRGSVFRFWVPQKVVDATPLASVENPAGRRVLVLCGALRGGNIARMLAALGVEAQTVQPGEELPPLAGFTHCLYDDAAPAKLVHRLRRELPGCVFAALRDMRSALGVTDLQDTILFTPLLITDLARLLNQDVALLPQGGAEVAVPATTEDVVVSGAEVLVVDDNEVNLLVAGEMLRALGAVVASADGGEAALAMCAKKPYDIVFMDHMMPGMDGIEVTARLRGEPGPNQQTPIIALTANVVNDMQSYYVRCGMDDFIAKPVEFADLSRALCRWLPPEKLAENLPDAPAPVRGPATMPTEAQAEDDEQLDPKQLVAALDAFGMYASTVVRELESDYDSYMERLITASGVLDGVIRDVNQSAAREDWPLFSRQVSQLQNILYDVGARDCAVRAKNLSRAAAEQGAEYIRGEFPGLMDNVYMLEKKLEVLAPLLRDGAVDDGFNNRAYLLDRLYAMEEPLVHENAGEAMAVLDDLAGHSLDRELDMALKEIRKHLYRRDFDAALERQQALLTRFGV